MTEILPPAPTDAPTSGASAFVKATADKSRHLLALAGEKGVTAAIVKNERYHAVFGVAVLIYMITWALRGYYSGLAS